MLRPFLQRARKTLQFVLFVPPQFSHSHQWDKLEYRKTRLIGMKDPFSGIVSETLINPVFSDKYISLLAKTVWMTMKNHKIESQTSKRAKKNQNDRIFHNCGQFWHSLWLNYTNVMPDSDFYHIWYFRPFLSKTAQSWWAEEGVKTTKFSSFVKCHDNCPVCQERLKWSIFTHF